MEISIDLNSYINLNELNNYLKSNSENSTNLSFKNILIKPQNNDYYILKYDKNSLKTHEYNSIGKIRSIIYKNNKILSFSPPKAINIEEFQKKYDISECYAEEFIEGTMINVFYNNDSNNWEITTKSSLGAKVKFYNSNKTFADMFYEACNFCNLNINNLNKNYCYTFILQHPENRIVIPLLNPNLYLIKIYSIIDNIVRENKCEEFYIKNYYTNTSDKPIFVQIPIKYPIYSYQELKNYFASMNSNYCIPGIMLYHKDGTRAKFRNPVYEDVRFLRGNQPKLQYQYLALRKNGKVKQFLDYYPEYKSICAQYRNQLHRYTITLLQNYINCYIKKEKLLIKYPHEYKIHMYNLHKLYLDNLRENKKYINKEFVIQYINSLEPQQIMYSLNYSSRK